MYPLNVGKVNFWRVSLSVLMGTASCFGQAAGKPDVLVLVDGEKLIGHLESADAKNVTFKSDLAGEVTVAWDKVQDLQSSADFAIARKGQVFNRHLDTASVPQGKVTVEAQKVTVTPATGNPIVIPVADTDNVIPEASFMRAFGHSRFQDFWTGNAAAGLALVEATQTSKTFTTALSLLRTVPSESWASPRYKTSFSFNSAYGTNTTPAVATTPAVTIRTNIIHAGLEQDEYVNTRLFLFGDATFDHNYSQGLTLQYSLGAGAGYVAHKDAHQELDFKAQLAYTDQIFSVGPSVSLIGVVLGENYSRSLLRGITLNQSLSVTPSFNKPSDYSANGVVNLSLPITKKVNISVGLLDSYLSDPPPNFKKNSFQFVTNIGYKIN